MKTVGRERGTDREKETPLRKCYATWESWGFANSVAEDLVLLGYDAVSEGNRIPTFWGNSPHFKGQNVLDMDAPLYPRRMEWS